MIAMTTDDLHALSDAIGEGIDKARRWIDLSNRSFDEADIAAGGADEPAEGTAAHFAWQVALDKAEFQRREAVAADKLATAAPDIGAIELQRKIGRTLAEVATR